MSGLLQETDLSSADETKQVEKKSGRKQSEAIKHQPQLWQQCVCVCGPLTFCQCFLAECLLGSGCQATPSCPANELSFGNGVSWQQRWVRGASFPFAEAFCRLSPHEHELQLERWTVSRSSQLRLNHLKLVTRHTQLKGDLLFLKQWKILLGLGT